MSVAQIVAGVTATVSGILAIVGLVDPGTVFAKPAVDTAIVGVFAAATPLGLYLWAYFHHQNAQRPK